MEIMTATTITISDELKKELLRVAALLQASRGEKIGYDDVLRFLVRKATRNMDLFREACSPTGVSSRELTSELRRQRSVDRKREQAFEHGYS
jgi:predicted CopG family antitoxin